MSPVTPHVEGPVSPGFEAVRDAFVDNFASHGELGGACCAYWHGQKVVDLWGGIRNSQTSEPWEQDTMVIVYSATKGLAAMTLALAHSRGWIDYDERVCTYWPEFAQQGKERITVRQLLAHQAGLFALDEPVDRSLVADLDRLAVVLARQKPRGRRERARPITRSPSAITKASCCAASIRSIAAWGSSSRTKSRRRSAWTSTSGCPRTSRTPAWPLGAARDDRHARGFPLRFAVEALNPRSNIVRALGNPSCRTTSSASMRATSKCRPAARSEPPGRSRTRTASLPLADASWGCGRRRWSCWRRRRVRRRAGSSTNV